MNESRHHTNDERSMKNTIIKSEEYKVRFWVKDGEFWKQIQDSYFSHRRDDHRKAELHMIKKHKLKKPC